MVNAAERGEAKTGRLNWNWQKFDAMSATAGAGVSFSMNGYEGGADASNLVKLVEVSCTCEDGNCTISDGTVSEVCEDCCIGGSCNPQ